MLLHTHMSPCMSSHPRVTQTHTLARAHTGLTDSLFVFLLHIHSYPCGEVYSNIWYFSVPVSGDFSHAYKGRLQFRLYAPSFDGTPRSPRGAVILKGGNAALGEPLELSYTTVFGHPVAAELDTPSWTYSSVLLDGDAASWLVEPEGIVATSAEIEAVLSNLTAVLIRGDAYVYGEEGYGSEVVYVNDVALYAPR